MIRLQGKSKEPSFEYFLGVIMEQADYKRFTNKQESAISILNEKARHARFENVVF